MWNLTTFFNKGLWLKFVQQFSEIDEAFHTSGNLLTRGEKFHREALRLLSFEDSMPCIATVQALLILQFEYDFIQTEDT